MTTTTTTMQNAREMLDRLETEWQVPLSAGIEISDRCNEVCVHCYQEQGRKGELSYEQLCRVLDELASMGVFLITLSGGEATLRKDFLQIVGYARSKGFAVRVFTNGLTMTRALAQALAAHAVQMVEITVYSTRAATHDFVTGVRGSWERTVAGVRHLVEAGVAVTMKTPVMSVNEGELDDYAAFAAELGAEYSVSPTEMMPREGGDLSPSALEMTAAGRVAALRAAVGAEALGESCRATPGRERDSAPCSAGRDVHIEPNGELRPCSILEVELGHALRDGIANAHASNPRAIAMRKLTWADVHGCRDCDLGAFCERCYAAARAHTGDALGPYAAACRAATLKYEAAHGHAPRVIVHNGHAPDLGPFSERAPGLLEQVADLVTPEDDVLAAQLGWVRKMPPQAASPALPVAPTQLIQIRRPGTKKPNSELGSVGTSAASTRGNEVSRAQKTPNDASTRANGGMG